MASPRVPRPVRRRGTLRRRASQALVALLLSPALPALAAPAPGVRTMVLVRHGEYDHADPRPEDVGKGLLPIGVAQARLLGARLRALGVVFDRFDASPLTRARQTAAVLRDELPGTTVRIVPELAECTPPTRRTEVTRDEDPEEMEACRRRLDRLFAERFVPSPAGDRHELLVAHGNVIRYLVTRALGVDTRAWLEMSVHNASLTVIDVEPDGRFKVLAVGDSGHLPPSLTTGATGDPPRSLALPGG